MKNSGSIAAIIAIVSIMFAVVMVGGLRHIPEAIEGPNINANPANASYAKDSAHANCPEIYTIISDQGRLVIGADDGIYKMESLKKGNVPEKCEPGIELMQLNIIMAKDDVRYVGGEGLFELDKDYSTMLARYNYGEQVNALIPYGNGVMVGTEQGLWFHCDDPLSETGCADTLLKPGVIVTSLAKDRDGLWVGTYGDGLYYYDGNTFHERTLKRDPMALATVNALEYSYPFLWVGTDYALFRYDGGKWSQMFVEDSSETYNVTSIMSTPAATYIGTSDCLMKFADDNLKMIDGFDGMLIAGFCKSERGVLVATRYDGIFTFNGKEEVVSPDQLKLRQLTGDEVDEKILAEIESKLFAQGAK